VVLEAAFSSSGGRCESGGAALCLSEVLTNPNSKHNSDKLSDKLSDKDSGGPQGEGEDTNGEDPKGERE
jgi:hypothetical protein